MIDPAGLDVWKDLKRKAESFEQPSRHLRRLLDDPNRLGDFSLKAAGLFFDFSRQRIDRDTLGLLHRLSEEMSVPAVFDAMMRGEIVNQSEGRPALHTAARDFSNESVFVRGVDVMPRIREVRQAIREFTADVHSGAIKGSTGKRIRDVVVVGIGGSYLGTEFVSTALAAYADKGIRLHYLANVDIHNFAAIVSAVDPEATLWVIISKSYTTAETLANASQAAAFMAERGIDSSRHLVTVTAEGSPGDDPSNPVLRSFHMFDFIGGRYSVTSAVGGVPLSLFLGYERFEAFLKGAEEMDRHARTAPVERNLPLTAALVAVWNNTFLGYPSRALIPYAAPLSRLAAHIQQLSMESNGKSVSAHGRPVSYPTGAVIFGEPGTNAQHSFFQLIHQGRPVPVEFIGVVNPQYPQYRHLSRGVTNHQELWANLLSQPMALAAGKEHPDPAKAFTGNRPSSTLLLEDLSPENIGRLLSYYEAQTVMEAVIWGINPFDQFGVELGKVLATDIRKAMAARNDRPDEDTRIDSPIVEHYLDVLFRGRI
ncbi:MAG: glucose-6-phosphate isomerase [Desulfobacterales bacterium]